MQPALITGLVWGAFIVVWLVSALFAKRTLRSNVSGWVFRTVVIVAALVVLSRSGAAQSHVENFLWQPWASPALAWLGALLALLGIALAIWARFYLGRNWGMPQSVKENPELVTSGPYAFVRHPIYTGMLLAMAGSALSAGLWWSVVLVIGGAYFIWSAKKEEALMASSFPNEYPAYKARTKMLVPFIF